MLSSVQIISQLQTILQKVSDMHHSHEKFPRSRSASRAPRTLLCSNLLSRLAHVQNLLQFKKGSTTLRPRRFCQACCPKPLIGHAAWQRACPMSSMICSGIFPPAAGCMLSLQLKGRPHFCWAAPASRLLISDVHVNAGSWKTAGRLCDEKQQIACQTIHDGVPTLPLWTQVQDKQMTDVRS